MSERKMLPEKYRQACRLKKGMEVQDTDGEWTAITIAIRVSSPVNAVFLSYEDGLTNVVDPKMEVMSR